MGRANSQLQVCLQPGDHFVSDARYRIRTLLGSCVSITLWHPGRRIGGMSHFLLPTRGIEVAQAEFDGRYGDEALQLMASALRQFGVPLLECQGKVFGGGNMFPRQVRCGMVHVGERNGEAARALLHKHGIDVVSESLFGDGHRQVIFDVATGDVWSHQVRPALQEALTEGLQP
jgi:chemotaxis protein CheD